MTLAPASGNAQAWSQCQAVAESTGGRDMATKKELMAKADAARAKADAALAKAYARLAGAKP